MKRFVVVLSAALAVTLPALLPPPAAAADASAARAEPFAQRFALDLDGQLAYYALEVPPAVYAGSRRSDLGDLRVFNGAGEPVPYSLDARRADAIPLQRHEVKWFPLPQADTGQPGTPRSVSIDRDGALRVDVRTVPVAAQGGGLIDLGRIDGRAEAVLVHLHNDNYQGRASVEASDDLSHWQPLGETQLLELNHGGNVLSQERIALDGTAARYLRLRWLDGAPDVASVEVEVRPGAAAQPDEATARQWRDVAAVRPGAKPGEYRFDIDGAWPVDRLRIKVPQPNTVASASIESRADNDAPWRTVANVVLFRLNSRGGVQERAPFVVPDDTDRQWRIVVDTRDGGLGGGAPAVSLGWRPALLTFLARGTPPFTLAVGNVSLTSAAVSRDALMIGAQTEVGRARLGAVLPVSPQDVRAAVAAHEPDAKRRWILWGALLLAVATLAVMAWRLARGSGQRRTGE